MATGCRFPCADAPPTLDTAIQRKVVKLHKLILDTDLCGGSHLGKEVVALDASKVNR
jgi:hypothetical protein